MSSPTVANIIRVPGRLCLNPTSLSTAYPCGGTALGLVSRLAWFPSAAPPLPITAEEFGGVVSDLVYRGEHATLSGALREPMDRDAISAIMPCYVAGAQGGMTLVSRVSGGARAGALLGESLGAVLCFVPDNTDEHPWLIVRRAVPMLDATTEARLRSSDALNLPVVWQMTPNSSGRVYDFGLRRDLTL